MTPREEWRGHFERLKAEAVKYAAMALANRKDAQECRRKRNWLGALMADSKARDFRKWRDERKAEARKIKQQWHFR